jgi:hypothetical protein
MEIYAIPVIATLGAHSAASFKKRGQEIDDKR